jgi:hypothetical protein
MLHPEFGYFCPGPRLQREVRVTFFAIIFGALIGSITVNALSTRARNSEAEPATSALVPEAAGQPDQNQDSRTDIPAVKATPSESQIFDDRASRTAYPLVTATVEPGKRARNLNGCEENSSPTAQGQCASDNKLRPVRLRSVNNPPEIARIPLGRATALEAAVPMSAPGNDGSANLELQTSQVAQSAATTSPAVGAEDAARENLNSPSASPKKPHKIARAQNRHRNEKSERVAVRRRWDSSVGRAYAWDRPYAPTPGFWVWSW